jgi:hypothetical protein
VARRFSSAALCAALSLLALVPHARATSDYYYKPDEYVAIKHGRSPDGAWSIAAHGPGKDGSGDEFKVYLMDGKTGKKIGPLTEITDVSYTDTAPGAYHAAWSADSQFVTISYRSDRHTICLVKYKIGDRRATKVLGPKPATDREAAELGWPDADN